MRPRAREAHSGWASLLVGIALTTGVISGCGGDADSEGSNASPSAGQPDAAVSTTEDKATRTVPDSSASQGENEASHASSERASEEIHTGQAPRDGTVNSTKPPSKQRHSTNRSGGCVAGGAANPCRKEDEEAKSTGDATAPPENSASTRDSGAAGCAAGGAGPGCRDTVDAGEDAETDRGGGTSGSDAPAGGVR